MGNEIDNFEEDLPFGNNEKPKARYERSTRNSEKFVVEADRFIQRVSAIYRRQDNSRMKNRQASRISSAVNLQNDQK